MNTTPVVPPQHGPDHTQIQIEIRGQEPQGTAAAEAAPPDGVLPSTPVTESSQRRSFAAPRCQDHHREGSHRCKGGERAVPGRNPADAGTARFQTDFTPVQGCKVCNILNTTGSDPWFGKSGRRGKTKVTYLCFAFTWSGRIDCKYYYHFREAAKHKEPGTYQGWTGPERTSTYSMKFLYSKPDLMSHLVSFCQECHI